MSVSERTSIVKVFMISPPDVVKNVGHQLARDAESVCVLFLPRLSF
jgi:hypothetical protein